MIVQTANVTLVTPDARVALRGEVLPDLGRCLQRECESLSARLLWDDLQFRVGAFTFLVNGAAGNIEETDTWVKRVEARIEQTAALYAFRDETYGAVSPKVRKA